MTEDWDRILEGVLRPERPRSEACARAHRQYVAALADRSQGRTRLLGDIESRLNAARDRVFAEGTGVVPAEITALEREWLDAARAPVVSRDLATLWQQIAPARWLARGRAAPATAEAMVALASDPEGVEAAERAADELRAILERSGRTVGARVDWIVSREITFAIRAEELFAATLASIPAAQHEATQRAHRLRREVRARLAEKTVATRNSSLARELGWLAFASSVWGEVKSDEPAPFAPMLAIYRLGYVPTAIDASGITLTSTPAT